MPLLLYPEGEMASPQQRPIEVEVTAAGTVRALEPGSTLPTGRALLIPLPVEAETATLSEASLAEDWLRPEEDDAWAHLHPGR